LLDTQAGFFAGDDFPWVRTCGNALDDRMQRLPGGLGVCSAAVANITDMNGGNMQD
jgi:hypothetical protein